MSFVPYSHGVSRRTGALPKTLLFWALMIILAVVLWQLAYRRTPPKGGALAISDSDFMNQVDAKNVNTANFVVMQDTADVSGQFKQDGGTYGTTVPRDTLPDLLESLRQQGTDVGVTEGVNESSWRNLLVGITPIFLLVFVFIFMIVRIQNNRNRNMPNQISSGALG